MHSRLLFAGLGVVVGLSTAAAPAAAQTPRGILSERESFLPIELAEVTLVSEADDTVGSTLTSEEGYFAFTVPDAGRYYVIAAALGYRAVRSEMVEVEDDRSPIIELTMLARPVPIEGVLVEADYDEPEIPGLVGTGFYDRAGAGLARGRGEFIFPGQILASDAQYPQALFWGMKTVRVHHRRPLQSAVRPRLDGSVETRPSAATVSSSSATQLDRVGPWHDALVIPNRTGPGYCSPSIYVDGVWLQELNPGESMADVMPVDELLAVEVYEWPFGVPQQYAGQQSCGVILFWTRAG